MEIIIESILFPLFLLPLLFLQPTSCLDSTAITTISSTQFLNDGETITSLNGSFTLGFFSPGNSMSRYLGIWYTKVTQQTVVWVANRESPLNSSSGVVKISSDGNLVLVDDKNNNNLLWSTNVTFSPNNSIAQLLDSGNLILTQSEDVDLDNILWQSFDHPSNTFLAGMKFGLNLKTRENELLTAWKNSNDPASGSFSLGFDLNKVVQVVIWNGSNKFWRSGQWNGQIFTGIPEMTSYHLYGFNIINSQEEGRLYCSYVNRDNSIISSFVLSTDGKLERFYWNFNTSRWDLVWSQPNSECEMYGRCGPNGSCNRSATSICSCLSGFKPRVPQEWNSGNWSGGCVRKNELNCNLPNEFLKLTGMKYPDDSKSISPVEGADACEARCRSNCFCVAYAYDNGLGCMVWEGDLKDVQKFSKGGQDIYLRFNKSDLKKRKEGKLLIVMLLVALGLVMFFVYVFFTWRRLQREREREIWIREHSQELRYSDLGTVKNSSRYSSDQTELNEDGINKGKGHDLPTFGLDMIQIATDSFSYANKLGQGGFGPVYKGQLPSGQEIAVKRLSKGSGQGMMEFENEVILIAKLQHRNLVRLLGCCMQGEERMLVYEYMPNKSLDAFLFDQKKREVLNWKTRFYIIEGIARGLLYLHRDSRLRIIHRDLKASNILLDADMNPKISDFGMARIFGGNQIQANTMRVVGTYGYLAPEYAMEGLFSVKSDVFSFGVLLLEIVSGKRNSSFYHPERHMNLLGYAWELWSENKMLDLLDPVLTNLDSETEVLRCIKAGLLCVQDNANQRPTMDTVMFMLGSEAAVIPTPMKPTFSTGRTPRETDVLASSSKICSANAMTISAIYGR